MYKVLGTRNSGLVAPKVGAPIEKVAELVAQMDKSTLDIFISDFEVEFDQIMTDNYNRMIKRAKNYDGAYWGIVSLMLLNDYTAAKDIMVKAETKKMNSVDDQIRFLFINTNDIKNNHGTINSDMIEQYYGLHQIVAEQVKKYDLDNGFFRRNTKPLSLEWEDLEMYDNRIRHGVRVSESMYEALWILLKFRVYILGLLPRA